MEPQPTSPTQQFTPPPTPPTRSRGPIIAAVTVGILILAGAAFAYTKLTNKPAATPSPTPDMTIGWETYANAQYGFELKYPENFRKITSTREIPLTFSSEDTAAPSLSRAAFERPGTFPTKLDIGFYGEILTGETKFDVGHDFVFLSDRQFVAEKTLASTQKAYIVGPLGILGSPCKYVRAFIPLASGTVVVALETCNTKEPEENGIPDGPSATAVAEMDTLLNQILSSFEFTGSTASWKTYTSPNNDFRLEVPLNAQVTVQPLDKTSTLVIDFEVTDENGASSTYRIFAYYNFSDSLEEWIANNNYGNRTNVASYEKITIDGQSGYLYNTGSLVAYTKYRTNIYQISYDYGNGPAFYKNNPIMSQILSTFTFTATTSCIPRPACLDATPRCLPPEPIDGWCK